MNRKMIAFALLILAGGCAQAEARQQADAAPDTIWWKRIPYSEHPSDERYQVVTVVLDRTQSTAAEREAAFNVPGLSVHANFTLPGYPEASSANWWMEGER